MNVTMQGDKVPFELDGGKYNLSSPYILPQTKFWSVSIKPRTPDVKDKFILTFVNKVRADVFKKGNVNVIKFYRFAIVKNSEIETVFTYSQKDMDLLIEKQIQGTVEGDTNKDKERLIKDVFGAEMTEKELFGSDITGDDVNINEMLDAWEDFYQDKADDASQKARGLLLSISDHYLTKDMLTTDFYIRNKMVIQAESLSMLFTQLSLTKQVLMKLFREIMSDIGNKTIYDAFAQQQKFVLEVNGFMNKTIKEVIDDMKLAKDRYLEKIKESEEEALEVEGNMGGIQTRDRKKFLQDVGNLIVDAENSIIDYTEEDVEENKKRRENELNVNGDDDFNGNENTAS